MGVCEGAGVVGNTDGFAVGAATGASVGSGVASGCVGYKVAIKLGPGLGAKVDTGIVGAGADNVGAGAIADSVGSSVVVAPNEGAKMGSLVGMGMAVMRLVISRVGSGLSSSRLRVGSRVLPIGGTLGFAVV